MTDVEDAASLLKILGHPVRLRIVAGLAGQQCACVKEIWECLGMNQAVVSQHLKIMRQHGILAARREGARVRYFLADERVTALARLFCHEG